MRKYISIILAATAMMFTSCDDTNYDLTESTTYFIFPEVNVEIDTADGMTADIEVEWTRTLNRAATLEFYTLTNNSLENPAVEGTDYKIDEKTISFGATDKSRTVTVEVLNDSFAEKSFWLVMKSSSATDVGLGEVAAANNKCLITIKGSQNP